MTTQFKIKEIKAIIGLGNPGRKYQYTYHNTGHLFVDFLKENLKNKEILVFKNDNYMNLAGFFVKKIIKKYQIKPENLLIVHDDTDLFLGKYKFSFSRGTAGHKGVDSITHLLKTKNFWRLRIGIRNPITHKKLKAENFVLTKITPQDKKILEKTFQEIILLF